jgi:acetyl esterase/lipase
MAKVGIPLFFACVLGAGLSLVCVSFASDTIIVEENVTYGRVDDVELKLDVARPKNGPGLFPAIVFIHGGGWAGGERSSYKGLIRKAAERGYFAATISYRLTGFDPQTNTGKTPFPAQIQDCKCAIRWVRSVASKYSIDPERIGVTGGSAGGHLSLLVALMDDKTGPESTGGHAEFSSQVCAVANYCGVTDVALEYQDMEQVRPFLQALCIGTPESNPEGYRIASPVNHVSKDDPPVLTLHGDKDELVPVSQAYAIDKALRDAGLPHELVILKGEGHAIKAPEADVAFWSFIEKHVKGKSSPN